MSKLTKDARISIQALKECKECSAKDLKDLPLLEGLGFVEQAHGEILSELGRPKPADDVYRLTDRYFEYSVGQGIRDDAKAIVSYLMEIALTKNEVGSIGFVSYRDLLERFGFSSTDYCYICLQYLEFKGCLKVENTTYHKESGVRTTLTLSTVDFLAEEP